MTTRHRWRPRCRIAHGWKKSGSFVSQQRDILPCTLFFFYLIHPSHIFIATPLFSFSSFSFILTHIFLFLYFSIFFLSFFSILILFSIFFPLLTSFSLFSKLSTPLFLACIQSEILNKPCYRRDETLKAGCVQGMRCTKEMYRIGYGIRRCAGLLMWKSHYRIHDKASNKR
jgi:hypothetical protein